MSQSPLWPTVRETDRDSPVCWTARSVFSPTSLTVSLFLSALVLWCSDLSPAALDALVSPQSHTCSHKTHHIHQHNTSIHTRINKRLACLAMRTYINSFCVMWHTLMYIKYNYIYDWAIFLFAFNFYTFVVHWQFNNIKFRWTLGQKHQKKHMNWTIIVTLDNKNWFCSITYRFQFWQIL